MLSQTSSQTLIQDKHIQSLHQELNELVEKYSNFLEQEFLTEDVECMNQWLEDFIRGSDEASAFLKSDGISLLDKIRCKLKAAAAEMQRIDEESPIAENYNGRRADRLHRAASLANQAECELEQALGCKKHQ